MFTGVISAAQLALLDRLKEQRLLDGFYMAGGTAAALQLGHRKSEGTSPGHAAVLVLG
ncbi:MAG: hypothetical protein DDT29_01948 [Dehalococcoidia bacterium]|nr:hypothetical protein [Bacillota bacterium]